MKKFKLVLSEVRSNIKEKGYTFSNMSSLRCEFWHKGNREIWYCAVNEKENTCSEISVFEVEPMRYYSILEMDELNKL